MVFVGLKVLLNLRVPYDFLATNSKHVWRAPPVLAQSFDGGGDDDDDHKKRDGADAAVRASERLFACVFATMCFSRFANEADAAAILCSL